MPGIAASVGLGKLTLQSALGQPLSAQIELTAVAPDELGSVTARIADSSLYRQNNLAYQGVLSRARVTMERLPNGDAILRVTTPASVVEPYLDLLVEVNWASGRVVRAYTFLLDPPGMPAAPAVDPVTPPRAGAPRAAAAPRRPLRRRERPPRRAAGAGSSYTVRRGDTLSRIAEETKAPSVTLEQMLVALFNSNQSAFDGNNMNRLRAGAILNVPSPEEAAATPRGEATKTVRIQAADWRGYQDQVAGAAPPAEAAAGRVAAGKIGTTVEEKLPAAVPGRDQLKVSPQVGKGAALSPAAEEVVARDKALKEAQTRIGELEKTLKDLQRALELKGQTGAQLQAQADVAKGKAPEPRERPNRRRPRFRRTGAEGRRAAEARGSPSRRRPPPRPSPSRRRPPRRPRRRRRRPTSRRRLPKSETSFIDDFPGGKPGLVIGGGALAAAGRPVADRRTPPQDGEVRGQHHRRHRHQDQHRIRLDRRRRRQHRRELARDRFQPRRSRQHRYRRGRSDRRSRGVSRLRARCPGRGDPEGRAEEGSAAPGNLSQAPRDPRPAQQAVGVRDRRGRAVFRLPRQG